VTFRTGHMGYTFRVFASGTCGCRWKASSVMEERLRFVARLLDGEAMTDVCRDFGVPRRTGYKIFGRYREHGLEALTDRSRRPVRYANQPPQRSGPKHAPNSRRLRKYGRSREIIGRGRAAAFGGRGRTPIT
jgi:hypothetical protein